MTCKATCKLKVPRYVSSSIKDLAALGERKLKAPKRRTKGGCLLEVSVYDWHAGKRSWSEETGQDYDLRIAVRDFCGAVDDIVEVVRHFPIERAIIPVGHDYFQTDNARGTTYAGTPVDAVDDRYSKVFTTGCRAAQYAVERIREVCDVEVIWVPGNHDTTSSFFLCEWLAAYFRNDRCVSVDTSPKMRKYRSYGPSLFMYTHGDEAKTAKFAKLPLIMATEVPELWASAKYRSVRCGHYHRRTCTEYPVIDNYNGVRVDVMPSLSSTDAWHFANGFIGNTRAAEAWLWSKHAGFVGQFSVTARSQVESWNL
jgi:hypothetical protein